jgi:hypothetical protein
MKKAPACLACAARRVAATRALREPVAAFEERQGTRRALLQERTNVARLTE